MPGGGRGAAAGESSVEARGEEWSAEDEEAFKAPIRDQYESQGHPYYATARLWDDGIIEPAATRDVLALAFDAALQHARPRADWGVFRM